MIPTNVAVVGGGIGGAVASLLLARMGAKVTCFERVSEPRAVGAGIALQPNGMAVLAGLGLRAAIDARATLLESPRIVDGTGKVLLAPMAEDHVRMIRRSDLHALLVDALHVEVDLRTGVEVTEAPAGFELVIGADGVHSKLRDAGAFGGRVRRTGTQYARGLVDLETTAAEEAWTSAGIFGRMPVPGGTYFYASTRVGDDLLSLREEWARAYPASEPVLRAIAHADRLLVNEVLRVDCRSFVDGNVALLGDAAHAMAPNLGQGANSALVDAAVLCDELRRAPDLPTALVAYDLRRRPAVRRVQDLSGRVGAVAERTGAVFRWFRDRALAYLPTADVLQETPAELSRMAAAS